MSNRIVEGVWDCPYCGQKAIGGLQKHCPLCGHPQDKDTKFYIGEEIHYIEEEKAAEYGQGADWICEYCGSMNRVHYKYCSNCGAPKEAAKQDYFHREEKKTYVEEQRPSRFGLLAKVIGVAVLMLAITMFISMPKSAKAEITEMSWTRTIDVESVVTMDESDWTVPDGGKVYDEKQEIMSYKQVIDHYELRTRQVPVSVYDGEDYHTEYVDNGDGTFTERTYTTPRYRTEYETETYNEPIYRNDPVYGTRYYYKIKRWIPTRTVETSGDTKDPVWGEVELAKGEREGAHYETYTIKLNGRKKSYTTTLNLEDWEKFNVGDNVKLKVHSLNVYEINGIPTLS